MISVAYSPDADDAFMFWALETGRLTHPYHFNFTQLDTEALNQEALKGTFDISAVSIGVLPRITETYRLLPHGGSIGQNYGPVVVAKDPSVKNDWFKKTVAIPGENTTAALVLRLLHKDIRTTEVPISPFSEAFDCLSDGRAEASVLIHEGRLTYKEEGCYLLEDLGQAWFRETQLPLPLGGNVIKRSLSEPMQQEINLLLSSSIREALDCRREAIHWLMNCGLGNLKTYEEIDNYLNLYANEDTAHYSNPVYKSIEVILEKGFQQNLLPQNLTMDSINDSFWSVPQ